MATVVNDRDVLLQAASPRYTASSASALLIASSAPTFTVDVGGTPTPSSITFNAVRLNVSGTATFSTSDGSTLTVNGDTATLAYSGMPSGSSSTTVTVTVNDGGTVYSRSTTITKVRDGQSGTGTTGQRGAGTYQASGSAWSDTAAHLATPGETVVDDQVIIWNGSNFAEQRRWDGSAWVASGAHIPGDLIVGGTIVGNKLKAGTIELFAADGITPILTLGGLRSGFEAPNTKNSDFQNGTLTIGGDNLADNSSFEKASGGLAAGYFPYNNDGTNEPGAAYDIAGRTGGRAQLIEWANSHWNTKGILGRVHRGGWLAGKTYIISVWARTTNLSSTGGLVLEWNTPPASGAALQNPNLSSTWQRYAWKITWGASVESGGVAFISVHYGGGAGNVIFDDLMVVEGDVLPAYAPSTAEAKSAADSALGSIDAIFADGTLSRDEKPQIIQDWNTIYNEANGIYYQANDLGLITARDDYWNAFTALQNYLPYGWDNTGVDTAINRTEWNSKFTTYKLKRQAVADAVTAELRVRNAQAKNAADAANAGLADKLSKSAASALGAIITLQTGGALLAGDTTNGVYMHQTGLVGVQNGQVKFSIPISGNPLFAGMLQAAFGSFGAVTLDSATGSFSSGQTAYDTGTGWWMGYVGGVPKFSIGTAGGGALLWDGTDLIARKVKFDALSATISGTLLTAVGNGPVDYGSLTVSASGGTVQSYDWSVTFTSATGITTSYGLSAGAGTATASFRGNATNMQIQARITCLVTFSDGRTASVGRNHNVTHGTYQA